MSETTHEHSHKKLYIIVFFALALLTLLELMIPGLETVYAYKAGGLIGLALGKAFLVAYFYMHLNEEKNALRWLAAVPLVAFFYAAALIAETVFR